uniref:Coiled-coil domain-containing protein 57 n=1 Tax=Oncorhynchus tshawytscha TaxID=74940 RepID=A0AAZ3PUE1_ONCTS
MQANDGADLDTQLACKEKEWKELQTLRVQQQDVSLRDAQEQLSLLRERFQQLKEDFCFNLAVLEERDRELERYDAMAARAQATETARQEELSQLRIQIAKLQEERESEAREVRHSQQRAAEHRLQLERLQSGQAGDLQKQRAEYDGMKRDLQRRVQEVEGQLALQKQEMMTDFDNEMRQREHEFNLRMDEMRAVVLSHELRVKLLSKETEVHSQAQAQAVEALKASEDLCQHTHTQLQHRHWEIKDITAVKDARIKELVDKIKALQTKMKREEEVYNKKHEQLDRGVREREAQLDALKDAHREQLRQAETHSGQLQSKLEAMATHTHRTQRDHDDTLRERDQQIDRYKQQLFVGVEREKALEQRRIQVELEWQRRCEDNKTEHYLHSEELIQGLTQARDQASAELREKERELQDMAVLLHTVTKERDQALGLPIREQLSALQGHRPGGGVSVGELPSDEIHRLQQQNSSLRAVIAQMRRDMEDLSQPSHPPGPPDTSTQIPKGPLPQLPTQNSAKPTDSTAQPSLAVVGTPEYTQVLEEEVAELKARCRCLEDQLEGSTRPQNTATVTPATTLIPIAPDNAYLQNHIRSLNETIGGQRVEKVANTAALRKQEVRVAHLEAALASLTKQCHTKQMEGEELRLELANQKRSWSSEERGLRQRLVVVEMELEEVRREKEEYQKGSILNNLETVALGNQVSALKIDIASRRDPIVCEESEMVRQLQEENLCLRQQQLSLGLRSGGAGGYGPGCGGVQGDKLSAPLNAHLLQSKLKQAVQCIARLTRDKQQLIEMGNRLRAQLTDAGLEVLQSAPKTSLNPVSMEPERDPSRDTQHQQGRLSALEQLQYQLTTQELQYAQREQRKGAPIMVRPLLSESKSGDRDRVINPWGQGHKDTDRHERPRTKENTPPISQSQSSLQLDLGSRTASSPSGPLLLSSVATEGSLREVWQILDRGLSPSILTPQESCSERGDGELNEPSPGDQAVRVKGCRAPVLERMTPARPSATARKTKTSARGGKIRNYNIKD